MINLEMFILKTIEEYNEISIKQLEYICSYSFGCDNNRIRKTIFDCMVEGKILMNTNLKLEINK